MDVILRFHWQAIVDDVRDAGDVDAASGNVGCDQNFGAAITQRLQATIAHHLWHRAVQAGSSIARLAQLVGQLIGLDLRRGKHDGLPHRFVLQIVFENRIFVRHVVVPMQTLFDVLMHVLRAGELDFLRAAHHVRRQLHDARREGGAEHERAVTFDRGDVNGFQILGEAEIQHAISFVHDERLHGFEIDLTVAVQVEQTTRRCDHEIRAAQIHQLFAERRAADDVGDANATAKTHQADRFRADLLRQFSRWAKNQHAGAGTGTTIARGLLAFGHRRRFQQRMNRGQQEGGGFTAAGLCGDHPVASSQSCGNGFGLNAGRLCVAERFYSLQKCGI